VPDLLALRDLGQQVPVLLHVRRQPPHLEDEEENAENIYEKQRFRSGTVNDPQKRKK